MAREYGGSDTVLLQDNVSLDGRGCLVFAQFLGAGGAGAEHLEDHDGFPDDRFARGNRCAIDEGVGVADAAHDLDFQGRAHRPALLTAKMLSQQRSQSAADELMRDGAAGHCDRLPSIKLIA